MSTGPAASGRNVARTRTLGALIIGDTLSFLLFAALGRAEHGLSLAQVWPVLVTAAPFWAGWLLVAPLLGALRPEILNGVGRAAGRTALAWLVAGPTGLLLRSLMLGRGIVPSFAVVAMTVNLLLLIAWRGGYARLRNRTRERGSGSPRLYE